jgi:hypothetical protein
MSRKCEGCGKPDAPYYDYRQKCTCGNDAAHGLERHQADCFRVRHSIVPYLTQLRRVRRTDQFADGQLLAPPSRPHEFARLVANGFRVRAINGYLYSERILCTDCIRIWNEREENRKHFERAKRGAQQQNYYQVLASQ